MKNLTSSKAQITPKLEDLTQKQLQDLVDTTLSNQVLTEKQVADIHLMNNLLLSKSEVPEKQIAFNKELENKIKEAKAECFLRIASYDGKARSVDEWILKSQNLQDAKTTYTNILISGGSPTSNQVADYNLANAIIDRKNQLLTKYEALKNKILACQTIEELDLIIVKDDIYWIL